MDKVSFEEIGSLLVSFYADEGVEVGQVVKVSENGTVAPCDEDDLFCGVAVSCKDGVAGVQVDGFVRVPVTLPMSVGRVFLTADGEGGVQEAEAGVSALVVDVDTADESAVICL